jgi:hypothetical protein
MVNDGDAGPANNGCCDFLITPALDLMNTADYKRDHLHLILIINQVGSDESSVVTCHSKSQRGIFQSKSKKRIRQFGKPIPGSVSTIINQHKSSVQKKLIHH